MIRKKRGAIELSMTTVVIVVLSLTLLIMGFVLVRSIMCSAIGLTDDVGAKAKKQITDFFETSSNEVYCVGQGDAIKVSPGVNKLWCGFNSKTAAEYTIKVKEIKAISSSIPTDTKFTSWIRDKTEDISVVPGQKDTQPTVVIEIPDDAPEGQIKIVLETKKNGGSPSTLSVFWDISRKGLVQNLMC